MACELAQIQTDACTSGIGRVRDKISLLQIIARLTCEASEGGGGASVPTYKATLTQTGTNAPVATVLENTLGGTVVWAYSSTGVYTATLAGAFTANKTFMICGSANEPGGSVATGSTFTVQLFRQDANTIMVRVAVDGNETDERLVETAIEIQVFP